MVLLCHLRDPLTVYGLAFAQGGIEQAQKHFQINNLPVDERNKD
jgi:hypothetical protein